MDRYHLVVLIFLVGGMGIATYRGDWLMFWAMVAGAVGLILYGSWAAGRERRAERRRKRRGL